MSQEPLEYSAQAETLGRRTRRFFQRWWPLLLVLVILLGGIGWAMWSFLRLQVNDPIGNSSPAIVQEYTGVTPPPEASNLRAAGHSKGMIWSHYVRFEAPAPVCLAYAQKVVHGTPLTTNFTQLSDGVIQNDRRLLRNMTWFDLPSATNLVGADFEGSTVWVDQDHGVFYFFAGF